MKLILCTLAAFVVLGATMVHPADAACWWNGYGWQCWHPWHYHYAHWGYWHHGGWGWHHWRH
jgi:hypothetical protein